MVTIEFVGEHRGLVNYNVGSMRHAFSARKGYTVKEVTNNYADKIVKKHPKLFKVVTPAKPKAPAAPKGDK